MLHHLTAAAAWSAPHMMLRQQALLLLGKVRYANVSSPFCLCHTAQPALQILEATQKAYEQSTHSHCCHPSPAVLPHSCR